MKTSPLELTIFLISLSNMIQGFESAVVFRSLKSSSPWYWEHVRREYEELWEVLRRCLDGIMGPHVYLLAVGQIGISILLFFYGHWVLSMLLGGIVFLLGFRFRGVFCGGSDYMTIATLVGLTLMLFGQSSQNEFVSKVGIYFIAAQCLLSYLISGLIKLRNSRWRRGLALESYLLYSNYSVPSVVKSFARSRFLCWLGSWVVIIWESSFISILLFPRMAGWYLLVGFLFHLFNFFVFGLNRFVFAWLAAYPAILFAVQ